MFRNTFVCLFVEYSLQMCERVERREKNRRRERLKREKSNLKNLANLASSAVFPFHLYVFLIQHHVTRLFFRFKRDAERFSALLIILQGRKYRGRIKLIWNICRRTSLSISHWHFRLNWILYKHRYITLLHWHFLFLHIICLFF